MSAGRRLIDRITNRDLVAAQQNLVNEQKKLITDATIKLEAAAANESKHKADMALANFQFFARDSYDTGPAMRIPYTNPASGGKFGEAITDDSRKFASEREPVARWLVNWIASDIFDNWFKIVNLNDEDSDDGKLNEAIQKVLLTLDAKKQLTRLTVFERRYGTSYLLLGYEKKGDADNWDKPVPKGAKIVQITPYPKTKVTVTEVESDPQNLRLGLPKFYNFQRGDNQAGTIVHYSRVIHDAPRLDEHPYEGVSILDGVYDDLTGYRNIRWSEYQAMYRYGTGFPHITIPGVTREQIAQWVAAGYFKDLFTRSYFVSATGEDIQFKGVQSVTLNPEPYNKISLDNLAIGTRIPQDVLKGVSAGAVTGSEVNERAYHKLISSEQSDVEFVPRDLINLIMDCGLVEWDYQKDPYKFIWGSSFEINEKDQAQIDLWAAQGKVMRLNYMTLNEVRAQEDLDPIEGGDVVIGLIRALTPIAQARPEEEKKEEKPPASANPFSGDQKTLEEDLEDYYLHLKNNIKIDKQEALIGVEALIRKHVDATETAQIKRLETITGKNIKESSPEAQTLKDEQIRYYMSHAQNVISDIIKAKETD